MIRKKVVTVTFGLKPESRERLEELAATFGFFWGDKPSVNRLLEAIGEGKLNLHDGTFSQVQIPTDPTVVRLLQLIEQQQPFRLTYESPGGKLQSHLCLYAELMTLEGRNYIAAYCPESAINSREISELANNWLFRTDRLQNVAVVPVENPWHSAGLDSCEAQFLLKNSLSFAYEPHINDISQEWVDREGKTAKLVTRRIYFGWFFRREILSYSAGVELLEPTKLRDLIKDELQKSLFMYQ